MLENKIQPSCKPNNMKSILATDEGACVGRKYRDIFVAQDKRI